MRYSFAQLSQIALENGFDISTVPTIAAIGMAESGGDDQAVNPNDPNGGSFGVLQINGIHPGAKDTLGNAALAFKMAFEISKNGSNFSPWSTYTSGRYLKFLPSAPTASLPQTTQSTVSTMNPAANAAASGSTAGAAVIVLGYALTFLHVALPADVVAAIQILLTSGIGYFLHTRTRSKS